MPGAGGFDAIVADAVSKFGAEVRPQLKGPGGPEDQLRGPTETLIRQVASALGLKAVLHGEVRLVDLHARPDYAVDVAGAPVGYLEVKRPGKGADPESFTGRDAEQWRKLVHLRADREVSASREQGETGRARNGGDR